MSDLINRKKIRDYIKGEINPYGKPFEGTAYELGFKIMRYIDTMDSDYDVDKVVEELNTLNVKAIKRYKGGTFGDYEGTDYYIKKSEAIEIVKQGGVSDDVCEWKSKKINNEWELSCKPNSTYNVFGVAWFKRCPYCGKKVKVVE